MSKVNYKPSVWVDKTDIQDGSLVDAKAMNNIEKGITDLSKTVNKILDTPPVEGPIGPQGIKGDRGDIGPSAYDLALSQGFEGTMEQWLQTLKGDRGERGIQGEKGEPGRDGAQGPKGQQGEKGERGPQGIQGLPGRDGVDGEQGPQGPRGEKGERGIQGVQGLPGEKGETGERGPKGDTPDMTEFENSINAQITSVNNWIKTFPVKITDYVSKKNGDDWAPVINYLTEQGYRNIVIPSGVYKFLTIAYLVDGLQIRGEYGAGFNETGKTVIEVSTTAFTFNKSNILAQHQEIVIEDIVFKGGTSVIDFGLCHVVTLKNITFMDFTDNGVILTRGERHNFENITFWSKTKSFNIAFAFADKTLSTHTEIQNMNFGVDGEWIDRMTIKNCTTMFGSKTRYNYSLWGGNKLSHSTIHNFYCHGGLTAAMKVKTIQQSDLFNWVIDGWGTTENPCEILIDIQKQAIDCNFTSISPAFAGNNKCVTQFRIAGGQGITVQSCYAIGDNTITYGFKLGNGVGQHVVFIGCRGAFYSEGGNDLIKNQINHIGCSYSVSNTASNVLFNPQGLNEIHNLMNDLNGATKSTGVVKYLYSRGNGNIGTMLEFAENIIKLGHAGVHIITGNGSPENVVSAPQGSVYLNKDGGVGTSMYTKETGGAGKTGWVAKPDIASIMENTNILNYLTPKMFGAVGDGVTDDTEALRRAIRESHTTGKILFFPNDCKCLVSAPLNYYNNNYYDVKLNIRGTLPTASGNYILTEFGGIMIKQTINLFYKATIKGEISNLSIVGIRNENLHFFDSCDLSGMYIHGCNITNFGAFLFDSGMSGVTRIDSNNFLSVFYFHRYGSVAKSIVDSFITNNYINGGQEPTNNACFEFQNGNGSTIQGNFIDYYKSIYRPKPLATVEFPTSIGNQYQVFLYLYEITHGGTFHFTSINDTFNWNDESSLAKLKTYEKSTYVGKDGITYEIPTYIAMGRHSSSVNIKNAYIQSHVGNIIFIRDHNSEYALGEFNVEFAGVSRYRENSVKLLQGNNKPYYNTGRYIQHSYDTWFIQQLESLPTINVGWCIYPNGYRVRVNNQNYKFINKYNQDTSSWEARWVETDNI